MAKLDTLYRPLQGPEYLNPKDTAVGEVYALVTDSGAVQTPVMRVEDSSRNRNGFVVLGAPRIVKTHVSGTPVMAPVGAIVYLGSDDKLLETVRPRFVYHVKEG